MGCSSCSSGGGTPRGCKNNGTCSAGGCNKLDVFDWLGNMSLGEGVSAFDMYEVRFKNSRKGFFRNSNNLSLQVGDVVVVEASPGYDVGVISVGGELARIQIRKKAPDLKPLESKKILRIANQVEIDKWIQGRTLEKDVMYQARSLAVNLKLEMKISDVEYQADLSKATFYYTAEGRVDFRQLIKDMADKFKIRVWDTTADTRYMIMPLRPSYTAGWSEEKLAQIITKESLIGVSRLEAPYENPDSNSVLSRG
jgi:hypothetical protein